MRADAPVFSMFSAATSRIVGDNGTQSGIDSLPDGLAAAF